MSFKPEMAVKDEICSPASELENNGVNERPRSKFGVLYCNCCSKSYVTLGFNKRPIYYLGLGSQVIIVHE